MSNDDSPIIARYHRIFTLDYCSVMLFTYNSIKDMSKKRAPMCHGHR